MKRRGDLNVIKNRNDENLNNDYDWHIKVELDAVKGEMNT